MTEITDGVRHEMHLCEHCATQEGITTKSQMSINELLSNLLASQPANEELWDTADKQLECPDCGFSLEKFQKESVLGCPKDYEVFEKSLLPLIERAHNGKTHHCGKIPSRTPKTMKKNMDLVNMQQQLEAAIKIENYELAAELRDKISQLE